jgi:hypothetical protein
MKIVHDKIGRKGEGQNKDNGKVPVPGKIASKRRGHPFVKGYRYTQERCHHTDDNVFIWKMKKILEGKIKDEMHWGTKQTGGKRIEVRYLRTFFYALTNKTFNSIPLVIYRRIPLPP